MNSSSPLFEGLNESQKKAVMTTEGPVLIIAGPGTGKTLTIVRRIACLIHQGVNPENIAAVTFTNRSAREMRERAEALFEGSACNVFIGTFHLLGLKIIRDELRGNIAVYDREEQIELLKPLLKDHNIKARQAAEKISRIKNLLEDMDDGMEVVCEKYRAALIKNNALDFDDLILKPVEMLGNSNVLEKYRDIFRYIVVDEYQDINPLQYKLLRLLSQNGGNICAIGDSDQAIYAFRGADVSNFLNFENDFIDAKRITLTENYRATDTIIRASGALIENNRQRIAKELKTVKDKGRRITIISAPDERAEGGMIVREIEQRLGGTSHYQMYTMENPPSGRNSPADDRSYKFSDFAVIFRTNAQARAMEEAFIDSGIPYQVVGRKNSRQRQEIEETISYLRSVINPRDFLDSGHVGTIEEKLLTAADFFDARANSVALMTLHMAKGLEFKVVFIAGVEDGLIPYTLNKDNSDIDEERRLFYVGMTRAKDELFLIHARSRFLYGQRLSQSPSPFIKEIPEELIKTIKMPDMPRKAKKEQQAGLF